MRRLLVACVVLATCALGEGSDARDRLNQPIAGREASTILKGLAATARSGSDAAGKLARHMSTTATLVDLRAIGSIDWDTQKLNRLIPEPLSPINTSDAIRKIGIGEADAETGWIGSQQQVRRLHDAAGTRQNEIDGLARERDDLAVLEKTYAQISSDLADHSARLMALAEDFSIEVMTLYGGRNFLLSALDFEFFVVDAARRREEAVERAIRRYDKVIASAKADLAAYRNSLPVADLVVSGISCGSSAAANQDDDGQGDGRGSAHCSRASGGGSEDQRAQCTARQASGIAVRGFERGLTGRRHRQPGCRGGVRAGEWWRHLQDRVQHRDQGLGDDHRRRAERRAGRLAHHRSSAGGVTSTGSPAWFVQSGPENHQRAHAFRRFPELHSDVAAAECPRLRLHPRVEHRPAKDPILSVARGLAHPEVWPDAPCRLAQLATGHVVEHREVRQQEIELPILAEELTGMPAISGLHRLLSRGFS